MKDAKGHGSAAHGGGVDQIGRTPMTLPVWYHGSPIGEPGPTGPVHVGTLLAASQALEARIGTPADGKGWDGTREYGKTLLAGTDTQAALSRKGYKSTETGFNVDAPKRDYYAGSVSNRATMGRERIPIPLDAKPSVSRYSIIGEMTNSPDRPMTDSRANGLMKRSDLKRGVYYTNEGEGVTVEDGKIKYSVSAVVPSRTLLRRV